MKEQLHTIDMPKSRNYIADVAKYTLRPEKAQDDFNTIESTNKQIKAKALDNIRIKGTLPEEHKAQMIAPITPIVESRNFPLAEKQANLKELYQLTDELAKVKQPLSYSFVTNKYEWMKDWDEEQLSNVVNEYRRKGGIPIEQLEGYATLTDTLPSQEYRLKDKDIFGGEVNLEELTETVYGQKRDWDIERSMIGMEDEDKLQFINMKAMQTFYVKMSEITPIPKGMAITELFDRYKHEYPDVVKDIYRNIIEELDMQMLYSFDDRVETFVDAVGDIIDLDHFSINDEEALDREVQRAMNYSLEDASSKARQAIRQTPGGVLGGVRYLSDVGKNIFGGVYDIYNDGIEMIDQSIEAKIEELRPRRDGSAEGMIALYEMWQVASSILDYYAKIPEMGAELVQFATHTPEIGWGLPLDLLAYGINLKEQAEYIAMRKSLRGTAFGALQSYGSRKGVGSEFIQGAFEGFSIASRKAIDAIPFISEQAKRALQESAENYSAIGPATLLNKGLASPTSAMISAGLLGASAIGSDVARRNKKDTNE